jgi:hypothetical protein
VIEFCSLKTQRGLTLAGVLALLLWGGQASAQETDAFAEDVLRGMSSFLNSADAMTYRVHSTMLEVSDGVSHELSTVITVALRRPDRFLVDVLSNEVHNRVLYDGRQLRMYHLVPNFYAQTKATGSVDQILDMIQMKLGIDLPLAELMSKSPYDKIMMDVNALSYLGVEEVDGVACHRLFFDQERFRANMWIENGTRLVPRRVVFEFDEPDGVSIFTARIGDWNFAPHLPNEVFEQTPAADAVQIPFKEVTQ